MTVSNTPTASGGPVAAAERLDFLDVLRGVAVLAIFVVNIKAMAQPFAFYANASLWTGEHDMTVAAFQAFLVEDKWRTIFTALFGAGLALAAERAAARGARGLGLMSRRLFLLALFGLAHLLLIWMGDILLTYALAGFIAMWFRNASARVLLRFGVIAVVVGLVWTGLFNAGPALVPEVRAEIEPMLWGSAPDVIADESASLLGGVGDHLAMRVEAFAPYILLYFLAGGYWLETVGIMLFGMWAYRIGFFSFRLPVRAYVLAALAGFAVALALDTARWMILIGSDWYFTAYSLSLSLNQMDGYFGAIGYAALIGLVVRFGFAPRAFAAAGRMAFTNYIACSVIGTTLFYGHGFALFGQLTNLQLMGVVAAVWALILIWSPLWLARFRFGPLEWLWRSLTYGRVQPFLKQR